MSRPDPTHSGGDIRAELRIRLEQTAPVLADTAANRRTVEDSAREAGADVIVFPELALTGYALGHRARELGVTLDGPPPLSLPPHGPVAVFGLVERGEDHLTYNVAVAARGDTTLAVHRKIYLPTYGTYDEGRVFAPGRRSVRPFPLAAGWSAGLLVCEDFWHPSLAYLLALQGADVLIVVAAAPGRGAHAAGTGEAFASTERWELIARTTALLHGMYVVLCNRAGVEDGITFAGGSMVVDPSGEVVARAPEGGPARLEATLERERVSGARQPFSHLRDDDSAVTLHTLERIVRER
ncbi:MAG: nitrilase-related carbon-nitrogen hydrolase [Longimicrobiales bacterium]|nr:nitrilase-related carbon-nitrogen hydrolase [Longimicrobiales bacterium]